MTQPLIPGIHRTVRELSGGRKVKYHRIGRGKGAKLFWKSTDGTREGSAAYMAAYKAALLEIEEGKHDAGSFRTVITAFMDSPKFAKLGDRTKADYLESINHELGIDKAFGDLPIGAFEDPRILDKALRWRDKKFKSDRTADKRMGHLRAIVNWASPRLIRKNHFTGIEGRYKADRSEIIWTDAEIKQFCSPPVPRYVQRILITVSETGLAPVDAVRLRKSEHVITTPRGRRIEMRRAKTGIVASMPVTPEMDKVLDEMPADQDYVLVTSTGKQWGNEDHLGATVSKWRNEIGVRKAVTLYDARGTAATRLLNIGADLTQIALAMGWTIETAAKMIRVYAKVNPDITDTLLDKIVAAGAEP